MKKKIIIIALASIVIMILTFGCKNKKKELELKHTEYGHVPLSVQWIEGMDTIKNLDSLKQVDSLRWDKLLNNK